MAAAYRSHSATDYGSRTNTTITAPAGVQDDDVLVLTFVRGQAGSAPATPTWPAGFTLLSGYPITVADDYNYTVSKWVLAKTASGEGSSYTVTHGNGASQGVMFAVSGASGVVAATQNSQTGGGGGTATATATGLTTGADDSLIAFVTHNWDLYGAGSPPTGSTPTFTERLDDATSLLYVATGVLATAGATGDKSHDSGNAYAYAPWAASLIEVRAAPPPTGRTAYWVVDLSSYSNPSAAEIAAGQRAGGAAALRSGSESFAATSGSGAIAEATAVTGLTASTSYRLSWVIYDDVAADYSGVEHATFSTAAADATPAPRRRYGLFGFLPAPIAGAITAPVVAPPTPSGASVDADTVQLQTTPTGAYQTVEFEIRRDE